ncbi:MULTISPECIES: hypothetical protein [Salimicrobium]|nr:MULTISPECIES: hypothetical protein [Salimicrobium]
MRREFRDVQADSPCLKVTKKRKSCPSAGKCTAEGNDNAGKVTFNRNTER